MTPFLAALVKRVPAHKTWELRQRVLRPHQRIEEMNYFGDHDAETAHFGAYIGDELLSIGSIYLAPLKSQHATLPDDGKAWQLRGMATAPGRSGGGLGSAVLRAAIEHATSKGGSVMWCHARQGALHFYEKYGFVSVSSVFELAGIGPHQVMTRKLA
jgi:ribosomal protein S18 acetylase RimI-like enzyme